MHTTLLRAAAAAGAAALLVLTPGPASAAGEPADEASCLARVFQAQAVEAPRTVAARILEIREFYLGDDAFGQVLQPLAHDRC
ncbi:hypothetical protein GCM10009623_29200 [Nocardioides aestuarii]|uniref:Uncharacterized protein n=1 Tax=Nocardioides aestuarii TaxID=252231 RepID=A0ABW4TR98_9ACTN